MLKACFLPFVFLFIFFNSHEYGYVYGYVWSPVIFVILKFEMIKHVTTSVTVLFCLKESIIACVFRTL